jgi:hypothetical protein
MGRRRQASTGIASWISHPRSERYPDLMSKNGPEEWRAICRREPCNEKMDARMR